MGNDTKLVPTAYFRVCDHYLQQWWVQMVNQKKKGSSKVWVVKEPVEGEWRGIKRSDDYSLTNPPDDFIY